MRESLPGPYPPEPSFARHGKGGGRNGRAPRIQPPATPSGLSLSRRQALALGGAGILGFAALLAGSQPQRSDTPEPSPTPTLRPTEPPKPAAAKPLDTPAAILNPAQKAERSIDEPLFYENWPDDNHCLQAAVMSVLNTLGHNVSWDEVNRETQYQNGLYSWMVQGASAISKRIPGTTLYSGLDYAAFAKEGEPVLKRNMTPDWYELQKRKSSAGFQKEHQATQQFLSNGRFEFKRPSLEEIKFFLPSHFLLSLINANVLHGKPGSLGHFVVVYKKDGNNFTLHDPGLPPRKGWVVTQQQFMNALEGDVLVVPKTPKAV